MVPKNNPKSEWGGDWTEKKLSSFEKYVKAYLNIMIKQKEKRGWPKEIIYFDGFAGSGERVLSSKTENSNLFKDYFEENLLLYKGSAERVLRLNKKFDKYYFVDNNKEVIDQLKQKLSNLDLISDSCKFICGDVNQEIKSLAKILNNNMSALIFLDPFGMQINWSSIEALKNKRVDIWILIPSGVIINRLLDKKGDLKHLKKLEKFFGLKEQEIKEKFYQTNQFTDLFNEAEHVEIKKTNHAIDKIAKLYIERLKTIWKYVTENPLKLFNTKNVPIYHFVFASNNQTAEKIAKQIID